MPGSARPDGHPLEYFAKAIAWMRNHPAVTSDKLAVIGASRGGELALLLGATFPKFRRRRLRAERIVWPGIATEGAPGSAWTLNGEQIPCIATPATRPRRGRNRRSC